MKWTAILAVAAASVCLNSVQTRADCPEGWVNFSDDAVAPICLYFRRAASTWSGMRSFCQALGADLAKVTAELHGKVARYIDEQPEGDLDDKTFWIGGTDEVSEGSWMWVVDSSTIPMGPPQWYLCDDQPDGGTKKNCLCLDKSDFYFHDCTCEYDYYGICQI